MSETIRVPESSSNARVMRKCRLATAEYAFQFCGQDLVATLITPIDDGAFSAPDAVFAFIKSAVTEVLANSTFGNRAALDSIPVSILEDHLGNFLYAKLYGQVPMYTFGLMVKHNEPRAVVGSQTGTMTTYDFTVQ